jgi:hypothetical protein
MVVAGLTDQTDICKVIACLSPPSACQLAPDTGKPQPPELEAATPATLYWVLLFEPL